MSLTQAEAAALKQLVADEFGVAQAQLTAEIDKLTEAPPPPPPPPTPDPGPALPVTLPGNVFGTESLNWMPDIADASKLVPRAVPWTVGNYVAPMSGQRPARMRVWHTYGNEQGLYSSLPRVGGQWTPQVGDQFKAIVDHIKATNLPDGPRGINIISPYGTAVGHPFAMPDGTPIPRAPTWLWLRHDGAMQFLMPDGSVQTPGQIPGVTHAHDFCVDESDRKILYVADLGTPDSTGKFTGGSIKKIVRTAGMGPPEDASKYVTTTYMSGLTYPTGVTTDEQGNVYSVDFAKGVVYRNAAEWHLMTRAFAIRYHAGKVYVLTSGIEVYAIDCATAAISPNLFAGVSGGTFGPGQSFATINIDRAGTFDSTGTIAVTRSHGAGNLDVWIYRDGVVNTAQRTYGAGLGYMKCGDLAFAHEPYGHYPWGWCYHPDQGRALVGGFTSPPHELVAYKTATEVPAEEAGSLSYGYAWARFAIQVIRKGGSFMSPTKDKPSLTCLMTREGWSLFKDCSSDEIAEMPFPAAYSWIRQGMIGAYGRADLNDAEMFALMVYFYRQSQRYLKEGGALMTSLRNSWTIVHGTLPTLPPFQVYV